MKIFWLYFDCISFNPRVFYKPFQFRRISSFWCYLINYFLENYQPSVIIFHVHLGIVAEMPPRAFPKFQALKLDALLQWLQIYFFYVFLYVCVLVIFFKIKYKNKQWSGWKGRKIPMAYTNHERTRGRVPPQALVDHVHDHRLLCAYPNRVLFCNPLNLFFHSHVPSLIHHPILWSFPPSSPSLHILSSLSQFCNSSLCYHNPFTHIHVLFPMVTGPLSWMLAQTCNWLLYNGKKQ